MRRRSVMSAAVATTLVGCSLTTSFEGLSVGQSPKSPPGDTKTAEDINVPRSAGDSSAPPASPDVGGASAYRALIMADGPVAYYRLSDTGGVAIDETGAHNGTYIGTVSHGPGAIAGDSNGSLVMDGQGWVD